ncbi:MAG: hypothetical protein ACTHKH_21820, partial [Trinickia sp.]
SLRALARTMIMKRIVSLLESDGDRSSTPAFTTNEALRIRHRRGFDCDESPQKVDKSRRKPDESSVPYS